MLILLSLSKCDCGVGNEIHCLDIALTAAKKTWLSLPDVCGNSVHHTRIKKQQLQ